MSKVGTEELYEIFRSHPSISTDSRTIKHDSIFFALHGASFDGNNYALEALEKGAAYAVVDREGLAAQSDRLLEVEHTLTSLQNLARLHRQNLAIPIVAITGSNGKTTTKELVATVLSKQYRIYATQGNLNNHIGVPLTLLSMDSSTQLGVVEMGASAVGEIALLCSIAQPNYGVITNIGRAHLEGFGGQEGIKRGKGELFEWLAKSDGVAFIPQEDETIREVAQGVEPLEKILYPITLSKGVRSSLEGEYNLKNIATAIAIASKLGVSMVFAREAIASYTPTNNRSQRIESEENTIIADCYNANPSSMEAAISNFAKEDFTARSSGKILILGDMLELGEWSEREHRRIIELSCSSDAKHIWLVGNHFAASYLPATTKEDRVTLFENKEALIEQIERSKPTQYTILIKGSRGIGLEGCIPYL